MQNRTRLLLFAPWVPPMRKDTKHTMPPPVPGNVGGREGVSIPYSPKLSYTPLWKRYANTTYEERMHEARSYYPYCEYNPTDYDIRLLPRPYKDSLKHRPLLEIGEPNYIPQMRVPVILLGTVKDTETKQVMGHALETVWVMSNVMREELAPRRLAVYATEENYALLGLDPVDHHLHETIPKTLEEYAALLKKHEWEEEPWKFSFDYLFRQYGESPAELGDFDGEFDEGEGTGMQATSSSDGKSTIRGKRKKDRKAKKVQLF
eukprot:PhM_4_TR15737/c0_g1_i1/m.32236